ncbi:hypothetical protein U1Q18_039483 [Sarracenia purpurea var. burkii]
MLAPSYSWMQTTARYDDICSEHGIPTMITWCYDGKEVSVEGLWDNWKTRKPLQRWGKDFAILKVPPLGVYPGLLLMDNGGMLLTCHGPRMEQ